MNSATIDRSVITRWSRDEAMMRMLPPLRYINQSLAKDTKTGCKPCGKRRARVSEDTFNQVLRETANYLSSRLDVLANVKRTLNANEIRIKYQKADRTGYVIKKL